MDDTFDSKRSTSYSYIQVDIEEKEAMRITEKERETWKLKVLHIVDLYPQLNHGLLDRGRDNQTKQWRVRE